MSVLFAGGQVSVAAVRGEAASGSAATPVAAVQERALVRPRPLGVAAAGAFDPFGLAGKGFVVEARAWAAVRLVPTSPGSEGGSHAAASGSRAEQRNRTLAASAVTGTITVNGAAVTITVSTTGDTVRLTFDGTAGENLGLGITSNTFACCPTVKLLDSGGGQVGSTQALGSGTTAWNVPTLPAGGSYTIVLTPSGSGTGTATFTLSDDLVVSNALNGSPAAVQPRSGQNIRIPFAGTANEHVGLGLSANSISCCPTVKLLDGSGNQVGSTGTLGSGNADWNAPSVPSTGSYAVFIDLSGQTNMAVTVTLSDDLVVSNALNGSPAAVQPRSGQNIRIPVSGTANEHVGLGLSANSISCCPTVKLLDGSGNQVGSTGTLGSGSADWNAPSVPSDGSYAVFIDLSGQTNMAVTVTLSDDLVVSNALNGSPAAVQPRSGQNIRIPFTGTVSEHLGLGLSANSISCCPTVKLLDSGGAQVGSTGTLLSGNADWNAPTVPSAGSYTVFVDLTGQTNMAVTVTLSDDLVVSNALNGSPAAVQPRSGQNIRIPLAGTANEHVGLGLSANSISCCPTVKLLDSGGAQVGSTGTLLSGNTDWNLPSVPSDGSYTVFIDLTGQTNMAVTLTLSDDVIQPLTPDGAAVVLTLARVGQNVRFTFSGGTAEPLNLALTNNTIGCCPTVQLLNGSGGQVGSSGMLLSGNTSWNLPSLPSSGSYTIFFDPKAFTGAATFKLSHNAPYQPPEQSYGSCGGAGHHGLSPSFCLADPVNSLTGAYTTSTTDLSLPGIGVGFAFKRSYTSVDTTAGRLGVGWTDSYSASLAILGNGDVRLHGEDGQQLLYAHQPDGSYTGAAGARSTLTAISGGYKLVTQDQVTYQFDSQGLLQSISDRNNQGVTLTYTNGKLTSVTDASGRSATLSYNGDGLLAAVSLPDGRSVGYAYTSGRLTGVTDVLGHTTSYSYDAGGRLATETDPLGHTQVTNSYGSDGRVSQQTDALGHTTSFSWNASTQTETATDARGNTWKDVYANNVLTKRIDALGNQTQFGTDTDLNRTSVTGPDGKQTTMTYDTRGNLTSATAPVSLNAHKSLTYDANNNLTSVTDGRNKVTSYSYDASGNNTQIVQDGTTVAQPTYNTAGQMLTWTDGRGKTTSYTYDSNGNVTSVTDPLGNKTTYGYDSAGRQTSMVDPRGNVSGANPADYTTSYTYDAAGQLLTETDPLGHTTTYTYDSAGNQTSVTDPNNHTTTTAYDAANRVTSVRAPDGGVTSYTYDAVGNRLTETDPNNHTTTYGYNANNEKTSVTSPKGEVTTSTYDVNGNLTKTVDPRGNVSGANPNDYATTYTYDAAGRLLTETDPLGHTTTHAYDAVGNETSITDANNHTTSYTYDAAGRILTVTAPDGGVTTYTYDAAGNELTGKDANNHITTYTYDDAGRLASKTSPLDQHWTYTYDPAGNLKTTVDANGNATQTSGDGTTTYGYDRAGRLTSIDYSDSTPDVTYAYDAAGNRTSMTDGAGTQTRTYDAADRLTGVVRGTDSFSYAYETAGNLTSRTYPDGTVTSYSYDADNQLASATSDGATTNYAYDVAGQLTQTTLPSSNGYVETRTYDRAGRLTEVKNANGTSVLSDFTSTLDAVGNPTAIVRAGATSETATYTYDANDRLTGVCYQMSCPGGSDPFIRWTYDAVGNRLTEARPTGTTTYAYNAGDELTSAGSTSYSYDQNGDETAAGPRTFGYDLANRLISTTSDSTSTTYDYDGDGNLLEASGGAGAASTTRYVWDMSGDLSEIAIERDGNGALLRRYVYGVRRISMVASSNAHYYSYDALGNVVNVTSSAGSPDWTYSYEPFGTSHVTTQNDPNASPNYMQFSSQRAEPTGFYDLRARQYQPGEGRFIQPDPLPGNATDPVSNSYAYVADKPTTFVDPTGMMLEPADDGQAAAITAGSPACLLTEAHVPIPTQTCPRSYLKIDVGTFAPMWEVEFQVKGSDQNAIQYHFEYRYKKRYRLDAQQTAATAWGRNPQGEYGKLAYSSSYDRRFRRPSQIKPWYAHFTFWVKRKSVLTIFAETSFNKPLPLPGNRWWNGDTWTVRCTVPEPRPGT